MEKYSGINESFAILKQEIEDSALLKTVSAFSAKDSTPEAVKKRVLRAKRDYWFYDRTYFSKDQYQNYADPGDYQRSIYEEIMCQGVDIHAGPRGFTKTTTAKKVFAWKLLTGRTHFLATLSFVIKPAQNNMSDIASIIMENSRIAHDFRTISNVWNTDEFSFRTQTQHIASLRKRYIAPFSEERSMRGWTKEFLRIEELFGDDFETLASAIGGDYTRRRIAVAEEGVASLGGTRPSAWFSGNMFDSRGYIAQLLKEQEDGLSLERSGWRVHIHKAWKDGKSQWITRYPAESEEEMMHMVGARTKADFKANWQQEPSPPEGHVFKREFVKFWDKYPKDARGVLYTDQNLALKSKGDTTAIVRLTYSPSTEFLYVSARCLSFSDPNELLDMVLHMRSKRVQGIGFDGNVSQESHWRNHIRAWCNKNDAHFPTAKFCRYHVDQLATNLQMVYAEGKILFDPAMKFSEEGIRFFEQLFAFVSKKQKGRDDAPDALICAYQFLTERKLNRVGGAKSHSAIFIQEDY